MRNSAVIGKITHQALMSFDMGLSFHLLFISIGFLLVPRLTRLRDSVPYLQLTSTAMRPDARNTSQNPFIYIHSN